MIRQLMIAVCAAASASGVLAQPTTPAPDARGDRPGATATIPPTPGPATAPALPAASLPPATVANREHAAQSRAVHKAQKKSKRARSATATTHDKRAPVGTSAGVSTSAASSSGVAKP